MEYHLVNILILMFLLTCTHRANCSTLITDDEKPAIENGLAVGIALAEALKDGDFADSLVKLRTNLASFLGVLGPLAGIILAFIPSGDSEELIFMRGQFKEINVKLHYITAEFTEVKKAIDWNTVVGSYGPYEGRSQRQKRISTEYTAFNDRHGRTKKKTLLSNTRVSLTTAFRNSMISSCTMTKSSPIISFRPWYNRPRTTTERPSSFP